MNRINIDAILMHEQLMDGWMDTQLTQQPQIFAFIILTNYSYEYNYYHVIILDIPPIHIL